MPNQAPEGALETWLAPLGIEAFRREYLTRRVLFREASEARLATALGLRPWGVADLLRNPRVKAWAWFQDKAGRHLTAEVPNESALALYRAGITLYLKHVPEVAPLAREIARALKVPEHNVKYTVFCSGPNAETRAHFDPVDTIALQIVGKKRWRLAPNALAPQPTVSWATLDGSEGDAEFWLYTHGDLPTRMPEGEVEEYLLEPGALLNVPRGYWHETDSPEASVSLHLHHVSLPWADAVLVALRALLLRDPAWREGALGLWDDAQAGANEREAGRRLRSLVEAASRLAPADVLPALARTSGPRPEGLMVRRARAGFAVETPEGGADASRVTFVVSECGSERRTTVEMSASYLRACRLFAESPEGGPFSAEGLAERVPGLTDDDARALVSLLLEVGFLRRAS
jgi:50S ribosomal protein L16 3-hydroxylase